MKCYSVLALQRMTAWWQLPLMICMLLPLTSKVTAEQHLVSRGSTSEEVMSKDFWLWFDSYADDEGNVFDPLDSEQLPANLSEQQSKRSVDTNVERSDVVGASATDDKRHRVIGVFEQ